MAKFLQYAPAGLTLYLLISNAAGQLLRSDTLVFEAADLTHLTLYAFALTAGSIPFRYSADIPALPGGASDTTVLYGIQVMQQVDVTPTGVDEALGYGTLQWDGTAEVPMPTLTSIAAAAVAAAGATLGGGATDALHCQVYGYERDAFDNPVDGRQIFVELSPAPQTTDTAILEGSRAVTYSNAQGYWVFLRLVRGKQYRLLNSSPGGFDRLVTVPDAPTLDFRAWLIANP